MLIDRPPEDVFAFLMDSSNDPLWQTSVVESRQVTDGPPGVGTRFTEVRHFLGRRMETTMQVTEHEDDRRSAVKVVSGPVLARMMRRELSTNCEHLKDVLEGGA